MRVSDILARKAAGNVITITSDATISQAAGVLAEKRIGALVVSNAGTDLLGILSERDIVRQLGKEGAACLNRTVAELMTSKIVTTTGDASADKVLEAMTEGRFRHIPVMDGDKLISLISIGDVVSAKIAEISFEKEAMQDMIMGR
jgi:CBS domain-containing protein